MPTVTFRGADRAVSVPEGSSLLDAVRRARLRIEAPCNGGGTCGKCRVQLDAAAQSRARVVGERGLSAEERDAGWVLLCSTLVEADLSLDLPGADETGLRVLEHGLTLDDLPLGPWISKRHRPERDVTEVWGGNHLLAEEAGDTASRLYGVAVDIGSTTLVVTLVDLGTGSRLGVVSALNPQATHAQDVLSRIKLGSSPEGLDLLHRELMTELDRMIGLLASEARVPRRRIYDVVLSGNTCMLHLAARIDPEPLGHYPYLSSLTGALHRPAAALGLSLAPIAQVYLPPVVSGFVGADITAGMLSTRLAEAPGTTLFVDIGTNGEMVLARDGRLQATSTAAGPAFEGMNIACGMRAARGAIERVSLAGGRVTVRTIDNAPAVGLCGSGLLDAVAELVTHGVVSPSGRFTRNPASLPPGLREALVSREGKTVFHLTPEIYLSQGDIRQVQLAKGAVRAGIDVLLARNGLDAASVDRALIAGSFGYHLTARSLIEIGLFPPDFAGRINYVGNTSLTGALALLTHADSRQQVQDQVATVEPVELANDEAFTKLFVAAMGFPAPAQTPTQAVA